MVSMSLEYDFNVVTTTQMIVSEAALQKLLNKRCSENMQQFYRITPIPKCDFNKVAKKLY